MDAAYPAPTHPRRPHARLWLPYPTRSFGSRTFAAQARRRGKRFFFAPARPCGRRRRFARQKRREKRYVFHGAFALYSFIADTIGLRYFPAVLNSLRTSSCLCFFFCNSYFVYVPPLLTYNADLLLHPIYLSAVFRRYSPALENLFLKNIPAENPRSKRQIYKVQLLYPDTNTPRMFPHDSQITFHCKIIIL